jgi:hypothetical protein
MYNKMELLSASMKNMEITILGTKIKIGVIVLIVLLFWILWGHVLCSCSRVGLLEGLENIKDAVVSDQECTVDANGNKTCKMKDLGGINGPTEASDSVSTTSMPELAKTVNPDFPSPNPSPIKEGFVGANINYGESSRYDLTNDKPINTSSWFTQNLSYKKGTSGSKGVQDILNRPKQQIPLPEGEMLMFANTEFKPQCCPNAYSNSTGCACMDVGQYNYLINRGGNNVPYSEY